MLTIFRACASSNLIHFRNAVQLTQVATLTGRATRGGPLKLKRGFPYMDRKISHVELLMDITAKRLEEENAKIIVVEGPVAAGKTALIKLLAEEFDMFYIPPPTMDELLITRTGFDLRNYDDKLPESVQSYDVKNFHTNPNDVRANSFQILMFRLRFAQYTDALAHVMNTGQGVILERSVFSDYAFAEAMMAEGYMPKRVRDYYIKLRDISLPLLFHPHIVIYLDVPPHKVQERIKARNLSYEVNSPVFTIGYLQKMEEIWKNDYLKKASETGEVLVYDWSDGGDSDLIVEELEELDLDPYRQELYGKFYDWRLWRSELRSMRKSFTNEKGYLIQLTQTPVFDIPEILVPSEDLEKRLEMYRNAPGNEYEPGYNVKAGDSIWRILLGKSFSQERNIFYLGYD